MARESEQAKSNQTAANTQETTVSGTNDTDIQIYDNSPGFSRSAKPDQSPFEDDLANPYRGLRPFGAEHARFFFGREAFVERLVRAVHERNFIALVGPSGSGKSSVVFAGLVPALEAQEPGRWKFEHFLPGPDPFHALSEALLPLLESDVTATERLIETRELARALHANDLSLTDVLSEIQEIHPEKLVLLIADQFEELYTLCPDSAIRQRFLDTLLAGIQSAEQSRVVLVLILRADFLSRTLMYRPFADVLQGASIVLGPMTLEEMAQTIVNPARLMGGAFEAGLVERILSDVAHEPGNLPFLQMALTLLWECRSDGVLTHQAYESIGGVGGALARLAEKVYQDLSYPEQVQARRIFLQLIRPGGEGTEDTRRRATPDEFGEESWPVVQKLADARLVVTSRDASGGVTVEVVHEALVRQWPRLQTWMTENREFRAWQERLRVFLAEWGRTERDPDALLRGAFLAEAENWLIEYETDLSPAEYEFIHTSIQARERGASVANQIYQTLTQVWRSLRQRVGEDPNTRIWQEILREAMKLWEGAKKDDRALLQGAILAEAEKRLTEDKSQFSQAEQLLIRLSIQARERELERIIESLDQALGQIEGGIGVVDQSLESSVIRQQITEFQTTRWKLDRVQTRMQELAQAMTQIETST